MYRFNQALVELGRRNRPAMTKIRENDQLTEISTSLEQVRALWAGDVASLRTAAGDLRSVLPVDATSDDARKKLAESQPVLDAYEV
jgi:hypothetical protein